MITAGERVAIRIEHERGKSLRALAKDYGVSAERIRQVIAPPTPEQAVKISARKALRYAVRVGSISAQPCDVCGEVDTEAHHDDYTKPLDVRWLCRKHHDALHHNGVRKMANEQIKSQRRREAAKEAITALGIPGVTTTRNLEAHLIRVFRAHQNLYEMRHSWERSVDHLIMDANPDYVPAPAAEKETGAE